MAEEREKYCLHCELKAVLRMRLEEDVVDIEEAMHCVAQLLGEIIGSSPDRHAMIQEAMKTMLTSAGGENVTTTVTATDDPTDDETRH